MRLEVSVLAAREIDEHYLYSISQYGFRDADEYLDQLRRRIGQLRDMPHIGVERSDVRPNIRLLVFREHNILYRVTGDSVLIVRVLHRKANWMNLL